MTDSVTAQGRGSMAQGTSGLTETQPRVSADSFRKLTSLLKKPDVPAPSIPTLKPALIAISDQISANPIAQVVAAAPKPAPAPVLPTAIVIKAAAAPAPDAAKLQRPVPFVIAPEPAKTVPPSALKLSPVQDIMVTRPMPKAADFAPVPPQAEVAMPVQSVDLLPEQKAIQPTLIPKVQQSAAPAPVVTEPQRPEAPPPMAAPIDTQTPAVELSRPRIEMPPVIQTPEQEAEAAELARSLLDMMAQGSAAGQPQERALAADTLLRMLPRLPLKSRVMLANRLGMMEQPHHLLVAKLITDPDITVAGPLLEECAQLSDEDLLRVVAERDPAKRRMMARRRKISRQVTKALIETDDPSVQLTIARNAGAEITAEGFALMEQAASKRSELLAPLCIRADLPVHFAFSLFWQAPPELRRYLLSRFLTDSETLTKILKIARVSVNVGDGNGDKATPDPEHVKNALLQAAGGDMASAASTLAGMSTLEPETITRILDDHQGEPLMALLKTLAFPRSQIFDLVETLKSSNHGLIDPARMTEELQSMFDSLSFNKARILLTYWDWFTMGTGPYAHLQ